MANSVLPPADDGGGGGGKPSSSCSSSTASWMAQAKEARQNNRLAEAIRLYLAVVADKPAAIPKTSSFSSSPEDTSAAAAVELQTRLKESAIYCLGELYARNKQSKELQGLLCHCEGFFQGLPRARTAKVVRRLMDTVALLPDTGELLLELYTQCVDWSKKEKRTFLRHRVEARLALLYLQLGRLQDGLDLVNDVLKEVKKLDDKLLLVELHLIESKIYWTIRNLAKSKAALTAARTNANAIHCPPLLQGDIDLQGGILHAHEKDFKTAFSYFFEAFEAFSSAPPPQTHHHHHASSPAPPPPTTTTATSAAAADNTVVLDQPTVATTESGLFSGGVEDPRALQSLKYLMLAKLMCGQLQDITTILSGKHGLKHAAHADVEALRAVAKCHKERSLRLFGIALEKHKLTLYGDAVLRHHIADLYETLLEQNILRILEPFSRVQVQHVADLIDLPLAAVQRKLGEMILDGKLQGTLDQGNGVLILFDDPELPDTYEDALATLKNMSEVVETLHEKAQLAV
eukprot:GHVS01097231.1.p1 GENE.GHVS01097231.1~~GHVS01097231.1.p1  ORF type:complete len:517 (-),score=165.82 GHVS01097231.1:183-1733(-)